MKIKIDSSTIGRFLSIIAPSSPRHTFQVFDEAKADGKKSKHFTGTFADTAMKLQECQDRRCGLFFMVNEGDGGGRSAHNVTKVRALFIDCDGAPWKPAAEALTPHAVVETSPGRFHIYWLISDCPRDKFKPLQQALAKKYDSDPSVCDLARVMRLPGSWHFKGEPFQVRLLELNEELPAYSLDDVVTGLEVTVDEQKRPAAGQQSEPFEYTNPDTGEVTDLTVWAAKNPRFDIIKAIDHAYFRGEIKDGKQHIVCPFEHEHTAADGLGTFIANADPPQHATWTIHCMHSHCAGRDRLEFLAAMMNAGWLFVSSKTGEPCERKRPSKIYDHVVDVRASQEWGALVPDEFRIALHLAFIMKESDDGMLLDDDWRIARCLGISESEWGQYRATLKHTGWLLVDVSGRLYNKIVKREFDNAQHALMGKVTGGRHGGLTTQQRKREAQLKHSSSIP